MPLETSVTSALENILTNLNPWWALIMRGCIVLGFFLVIGSVLSLPAAMKDRMMERGRKLKVAAGFFGGIFLIHLTDLINTASQTFFGKDAAENPLQLTDLDASSMTAPYIKFSLTLLIFMGLFAVIRGCTLLKHTAENPQLGASALWHIAGGMLAINITDAIRVASYTVGGEIGDSIRGLFFG